MIWHTMVTLFNSCSLLGFVEEGHTLYLAASYSFLWAVTLIGIFSEWDSSSTETLRRLFSILGKLRLAIFCPGRGFCWLCCLGDMVSDTLQLAATSLIHSRWDIWKEMKVRKGKGRQREAEKRGRKDEGKGGKGRKKEGEEGEGKEGKRMEGGPVVTFLLLW